MRAGPWGPTPPPHTFELKVFVSLQLASDLCAVTHSRGLVGKLFYSLGLWERFGVGGVRCPPIRCGAIGPLDCAGEIPSTSIVVNRWGVLCQVLGSFIWLVFMGLDGFLWVGGLDRFCGSASGGWW